MDWGGHQGRGEAGLCLHFAHSWMQLCLWFQLACSPSVLPHRPLPSNQPKTVLHLELKMCIPLPCSPVGKDSFCPFFHQ